MLYIFIYGIYLEVYVSSICSEYSYIQEYTYSEILGTYSDIPIYKYIHIYIQIHSDIYSDIYSYTFRNTYIFIYIQKYIHVQKHSDAHKTFPPHTKCAAGMLILVIIDMRDMVALFLQYYAYCIHTAFQRLSKYFGKLGNRITCP